MRLCTHSRIESGTDIFIEAMRRSSDDDAKFWRPMPILPPNRFVRAAETRRHALVMGEVIDDRPDRELALHMKRGLELARGEQVSIDAAQAPRFDIDEQARAAFAASEAWISLQSPRRRVAADDLNGG